MSTQTTLAKISDLEALAAKGSRCELIKGDLIELPPAGWTHGRIANAIAFALTSFVKERNLGEIASAETGFIIGREPDTVRAPDVSFVSQERLVGVSETSGFLELSPDLAVEVVSPGDSANAVQTKAEGWLDSGARLVWVVYPESRSVVVYRTGGQARVLHEGDTLDGQPVFDSFTLAVGILFE